MEYNLSNGRKNQNSQYINPNIIYINLIMHKE